MNKLQKYFIALALPYASLVGVVHAVTPSAVTNMGKQSYLFIDNQLDHEYFISSILLDPRFTGANVWARIGKTNQSSLGYMGNNEYMPVDSYVDYWLENSPIRNPFQGSRCWAISASCPSVGYIVPEFMDDKGSYKSKIGFGEDGGAYIRGSFASGAYEYFEKQSVGAVDTIQMNVCYTKQEYDPKQGQRCKDLPEDAGTKWRVMQLEATKVGHITLEDTKAYSEIWVSSDGTPSLTEDAEFCRYEVINSGTADQKEGVVCKMAKYTLQGDMSKFSTALRFYMVLDKDALGFSPDARDMQIQAGKNVWMPYEYQGNVFKDMFVQGSGYVEVMFSKAFFKKILKSGGSVKGRDDVFTFMLYNIVAPQSGYYQFRTSMNVDIIPREYSISIKPKDLNKTSAEGTIGTDQPINFEYKVTQSAPQKADVVTAQVLGESTTKNGQKYCLFRSDDDKTQVAIPAFLSYTHEQGAVQQEYSGCDESKKMDMTKAQWSAVPWDEQQSGFFYSTDLKLSFPMNDPVSNLSLDGTDWMGTVHAEGDVKVEAKWIGVDAGGRQ
jgi:Mat/Ecp fimbriae adhesin